MGKRLERFGEVGIVDVMNGFGLDFFEKAEWILKHHHRRGSSTLEKEGLGLAYR